MSEIKQNQEELNRPEQLTGQEFLDHVLNDVVKVKLVEEKVDKDCILD
jgi:hypothetical protein